MDSLELRGRRAFLRSLVGLAAGVTGAGAVALLANPTPTLAASVLAAGVVQVNTSKWVKPGVPITKNSVVLLTLDSGGNTTSASVWLDPPKHRFRIGVSGGDGQYELPSGKVYWAVLKS